jgi:hypothetical protein
MFDFFKKRPKPRNATTETQKPAQGFPPTPDWKPDILPPLDQIIDRMRYYTDGRRDLAVFRNGTCVILEEGLSDQQAELRAKEVLHKIFHFHPDMKPQQMDDGNILVGYNHPAVNVVLADHVVQHWNEIDQNHLRALTTSEVMITPLGPNKFDAFGKKALFGRCFMFMDAQNPVVVRIVRKAT